MSSKHPETTISRPTEEFGQSRRQFFERLVREVRTVPRIPNSEVYAYLHGNSLEQQTFDLIHPQPLDSITAYISFVKRNGFVYQDLPDAHYAVTNAGQKQLELEEQFISTSQMYESAAGLVMAASNIPDKNSRMHFVKLGVKKMLLSQSPTFDAPSTNSFANLIEDNPHTPQDEREISLVLFSVLSIAFHPSPKIPAESRLRALELLSAYDRADLSVAFQNGYAQKSREPLMNPTILAKLLSSTEIFAYSNKKTNEEKVRYIEGKLKDTDFKKTDTGIGLHYEPTTTTLIQKYKGASVLLAHYLIFNTEHVDVGLRILQLVPQNQTLQKQLKRIEAYQVDQDFRSDYQELLIKAGMEIEGNLRSAGRKIKTLYAQIERQRKTILKLKKRKTRKS